jgi:hypothetical protein
MECVFCDEGTEMLNIIQMKLRLESMLMFGSKRSDVMKTIHQRIRHWCGSTLRRQEKELRNFDSI